MELYQPDVPSGLATVPELLEFMIRENHRIALILNAKLEKEIEFLHVEPKKLKEGLTVGADGTDWNPGGGQGVYTYYSGTWNKLG